MDVSNGRGSGAVYILFFCLIDSHVVIAQALVVVSVPNLFVDVRYSTAPADKVYRDALKALFVDL